MGITLIETSRKGLLNTLSKYRKRYGIVIGGVACLALWWVLSNVVVTITIEGNETISDSKILSCLEDNGLSKGVYIPNVDFKTCEYALRLKLDNVAWASIRHNKGRVVVSIDETVNTPEMLKDNNPCNLVSTVSASIVSVRVLNGQLMTPIGNGVTKGQLLISGIVKNDKEIVRYVHAMGEVIGEYKQSITLTQPLTETVVTKEDTPKTYRELDIFNLKVPLYVGLKDTSSAYVSANTEYFTLFGNTIPIGIVTSKVSKYVSVQRSYSEDEAKAILNTRRKTYEVNFLNDVDIMDVQESFSTDDGKVSLTLEYTLQGNICEQMDIFVK
jgi:similar to stage IV sporulation protein